jgi:intracellular septation protein A
MTGVAKSNALLDLLFAIVLPSVILMKFSGEEHLGAVYALVLALAFPLILGARDLVRQRKVNVVAALGLVSVLLTGGIGLLQLDTRWLAIKEAAIPGLIGVAVAISAHSRYPVVRLVLFTPALMDVERIQRILDERGNRTVFDARLRNATWMLGGSFFFSAVMNYFLATWIVTSPAGSAAFNEELGRLTLVGYPLIALPSMAIMSAMLYYLVLAIRELTGLTLSEAIKH